MISSTAAPASRALRSRSCTPKLRRARPGAAGLWHDQLWLAIEFCARSPASVACAGQQALASGCNEAHGPCNVKIREPRSGYRATAARKKTRKARSGT